MRRLVFYIAISITGAFLWIVFNEKASLRHFFIGAFFTAAALFFTDKYLLDTKYYNRYDIPLLFFIKYPFYLIYKIYISGFKILYRVLRGTITPKITHIKTSLSSNLSISLLANSITLTPGTVSIDRTDDQLCVLYLDCMDKCILNPRKEILGRYEHIIGGAKKIHG